MRRGVGFFIGYTTEEKWLLCQQPLITYGSLARGGASLAPSSIHWLF